MASSHLLALLGCKIFQLEVKAWHTYFVSNQDILVHNTCSDYVPVNDKWQPAEADLWTWLEENNYKPKLGAGTDIGKIIVEDESGNAIGEIHSGQLVTDGPNKGKVFQIHFQKYINGETDSNNHLYFED